MPPTKKPASPVFAAIEARNAKARELALAEIEALKKDLTLLTAILKGRRKAGEFSPFDVAHGAFEIFRAAAAIFENQALTEAMENEVAEAEARDYLLTRKASLLVQPAGWHWISPAGRMYALGREPETVAAARKLARLIEECGKKPARAAPKAARPDAAPTEEPEADSAAAEAPAPAKAKAGKKA